MMGKGGNFFSVASRIVTGELSSDGVLWASRVACMAASQHELAQTEKIPVLMGSLAISRGHLSWC